MSYTPFIVLSLLIAFASFVQGTVGVGFALILAPLFGIFFPEMVPVAILILMLPLNFYVAVREWRSLDKIGTSWITGGRLVGGWVGVVLLTAISSRSMNLFIGISTIIAALLSLATPAFKPGKVSFVGAGFITGITETATGIGGPPLALIYQHSKACVLRSTLAMCFLLGELASLAMLVVNGQVSKSLVLNSFSLIPAVIIGAFFSRFFHHRIKGKGLRTGVMVFSIGAGIAVLCKELF